MSQFAAKTSGTGTAGAASTVLAAENYGRREITVVNDHATQILYIQLATVQGVAPTAVVGQGIRLNAAGGSWTTDFFRGALAVIASGAGTNYTVAEF
jgi:hypothetical protein